MIQSVFLSYHPQRDQARAQTVRESLEASGDKEAVGIVEPAEWKQKQDCDDQEVKAWITEQMKGTEVTVVLIGNDTANSELVHMEIEESWNRGNGITGIYVHNIEDESGNQDLMDANPLDSWRTETAKQQRFSEIFETYYWWQDNGYEHIGDWITEAAQRTPDQ